ncbi:MAG: LysR family transcriptional regulator [Flammeovirgaceae bacterium]|nr:MAG: LysR family transcriptional regulator [Flammeovirgaceae bacterium]
MNYTLHQLQIFLKVVEAGSVTKASEDLHLTQPAVSIQLKNFQDQFDLPLIEVVGRKLYVTDFGREVAQSAARILEEVNLLKGKLYEHRGQLFGKLRISVVSTGKYVMPHFIAGFARQHGGVEVVIDVTNKSQVIQSLENNEVDFSLVSILPTSLRVDRIDLMQNKLYLIGNMERAFKKEPYSKNLLRELPLIFREKGSGTRQTMEAFINRNNIPVVRKMELTSNEAVKQAVLAGLGYSIMPLIGIKNELHEHQLQIIPVKGLPIKTTWSLIWLKGKKHSPVAQAFLDYLRREKNHIVLRTFQWFEDY